MQKSDDQFMKPNGDPGSNGHAGSNGHSGSNGHPGSNGHGLVPNTAQFAEARTMYPAAEFDQSSGQDSVSLATYWHILLKRRWTIATTVLVLVTLVTLGSFKMKPIYRSMTRVQVEADTSMVQSLNDLYQKQLTDDAFLQTQLQVLKSENLAWQTIEQLRLADNATFIDAKKIRNKPAKEQKVKLITEFKKCLSVELVPKTRMITLGFESPDPDLAAQIATTLVTNYTDYNFRLKYDATRQASGWMEQQLDELKAKVEQSQQALVSYERQHAMANINAKDKQNVDEQMLSDLSKDLVAAQADLTQKESLYNQLRTNRDQIASLAHNELLQKLEEKSAELKGQYLEALGQYGPNFPKVVRLREQSAENLAQIGKEQDRVIERIRKDYTIAQSRRALAAAAVARQKEQLGSLNQLLVQHNILQREFEANQQLYQNLMQRLKDATLSAGLRSTNIHLVDTALPPDKPVRPRKLLNVTLALLAGMILGMVFAFAQEALDHSVKTPEELEAMLAIPFLGIVPMQQQSGVYGLRRGNQKNGNAVSAALMAAKSPTSSLAEAYRSLRTVLLLSLPDNPPRTLLVTSAEAGAGKTVNSLNLGTVLAQRKGPVLIVDCDLRKSGISRLLKIEGKPGLSTILTGTGNAPLQQLDGVPGLWVLPSGPTPPNPADLISGERMEKLLAKLSERFEHIIIDSPPVLAVADATILSPMVDGVVVVAQCGGTAKGALLRTCRTLENAGSRTLGVILNKFDHSQQGYYYSYYSYGRYYQKNG